MARRCEITGKGTATGNNVSHSKRRTRRTFKANVHKKKVFLEEEKRWVTVKISTRALRTLQKNGAKAVLKNLKK